MLDVSIRTELLRLMLDLRKERGLTYLFITHDLSLAWVIADRIAVMYLGKIMEIGPAERGHPRRRATRTPRRSCRSRRRPTRRPRASAPGGRSSRARRRTRRTSRPAAASTRAARWPSTGAGSRSRRCSTSAAASRRRAGWPSRTASCRSRSLPRPSAPHRRRCPPTRRPHQRSRRVTESPPMTEPAGRSTVRRPDRRPARRGATTVEAELGALGADGGWRPEPGEWSANECVGHLIEAERRGFAGRDPAILGRRPAGPPGRPRGWDPPAVAEARRDRRARPGGARRRVRRAARGRRGPRPQALAPATSPGSACTPTSGRCASTSCSRVGPPRPEPHPPAAGGDPGAGLGPDGQRPPVQPRGPLEPDGVRASA